MVVSSSSATAPGKTRANCQRSRELASSGGSRILAAAWQVCLSASGGSHHGDNMCITYPRGVLRNRQHDIDKLKLKGEMLKKYTTGYMPLSELVFLIYGIAPAMPIIGIQKWSPHYKDSWQEEAVL